MLHCIAWALYSNHAQPSAVKQLKSIKAMNPIQILETVIRNDFFLAPPAHRPAKTAEEIMDVARLCADELTADKGGLLMWEPQEAVAEALAKRVSICLGLRADVGADAPRPMKTKTNMGEVSESTFQAIQNLRA